jgi:hypothetical protein
MEKQSKNLESIKIERDYLRATLTKIDVNNWGLKVDKDTLSIKHTKL